MHAYVAHVSFTTFSMYGSEEATSAQATRMMDTTAGPQNTTISQQDESNPENDYNNAVGSNSDVHLISTDPINGLVKTFGNQSLSLSEIRIA